MRAIASFVQDLAGWRRRAVAFAAGILSVLALAPFHLWPVLFLTFPVLVWLIDAAVALDAKTLSPADSRRGWRRWLVTPAARAAGSAWWFAFGYFLAGLFWIGEAFLVEAEKFAVLMPFAVMLMPAGLALFWAAAAAVAAVVWQPGWQRILALALALSVAEWLRGHILTGFPWNIIGYALTYPLPLMQAVTVFGIYGLTLVAILVFAAPAVLLADADGALPRRDGALVAGIVGVVPLVAMVSWGHLRLGSPPLEDRTGPLVRIVQPSIPQREKWRPENQERIFSDHLKLSAQSPAGIDDGARGIRLIVWPEAAMPFLPLNSPGALAAIGRLLPAGTTLVSGALRLEEAAPGSGGKRRVFNALLAFGEGGQPIAVYDKIHLVPFGEYLPLQGALEAIGLEQLSRMRGGFDAGPKPRPLLSLPGLPKLGPLICYEAIFPGSIVQGSDRPAALLNVTNDGWFGNTTGPRQHLHQARVRAVEEGLPLLRAANNGISAVIDPYGRILHRLELDQKGTVDAVLPPALPPPLYARVGDLVFILMLLAGLGGYWTVARRQLSSPGLVGRSESDR